MKSTLALATLLLLVELPAVSVAAVPAPEPAAPPKTFSQVAVAVRRPAGFPQPSAVCFSSRWKHPSSAKDPHDTFQAAAGFHATGFYWISGPNQEWFREIKRHGYPVQGWLSTILPDTPFGNTRQQGRIMNEQGDLVTGPWMLAWKAWWGCLNSPEYRKVYLDYVKLYLDAGCDALHMDDPGENYTAVQWGGCYCPHCKAKAARLGKSPPEIQQESTAEFYRWIRAEMNAYAGRYVPFSCNSHPGNRYFFAESFDYGLEELDHATPYGFYRAMRDAEGRGKAQMYTLRTRSVADTRRAIALAYACGSHIIVPWDVYMPGPQAPRYFGKPEEYADLYGFARACAAYLDGYDDAAFVIPETSDQRYACPPLALGGADDVSLFVRAMPGKPDAPVVIHYLDRGDASRPRRLRFNPACFFGDRPVRIDLLTPPPYDAAVHARAEQTKDFSPLAVRRRLAEGYVTEVEVPAAAPWALIVVAPVPAAANKVWPPSILADEASTYSTTLAVQLECVTAGAVIRYTTDGSEPGAASAAYAGPISLNAGATVKARAFRDGAASDCATATFRPTAQRRTQVSPETIDGLRLWLRADDLLPSKQPGALLAQWPAKVGPAMVAEPLKLPNGKPATPPVWDAAAINGRPAVRFTSGTELLVIPEFANRHLTAAFTIFLVTQSDDKTFGICGNSRNGNGGLPRLYLTRDAFTYNATRLAVAAPADVPAIVAYTHDGGNSASAWLNGRQTASGRGPEFAAVKSYGGGNLAVPFWSGNEFHGGAVAEIIVVDRLLDDSQRDAVTQYLSEKYRLRAVRLWQ